VREYPREPILADSIIIALASRTFASRLSNFSAYRKSYRVYSLSHHVFEFFSTHAPGPCAALKF
jgi:hypothetical protein